MVPQVRVAIDGLNFREVSPAFFSHLFCLFTPLFLDNVFFCRASIDGAKIADAVSSVLFSLIK